MTDSKGSELKPAAKNLGTAIEVKPLEWEYRVLVLPEQTDLDALGAERWELVNVKDHGFNESIYYFKRPKI